MSNQELTARTEQIKPFLIASQRQITSLLQDETKAKSFMAAALVVASSPALMKCTPDSIVQACVGVAMSGLQLDPAIGHAYIIPYNAKENGQWVTKAQLQLSYRGFIQLLFRAGWMVKPFPVYTCDDFTIGFDGWSNTVSFVPDIDARQEGDPDWVYENLRGIYVVARHADTKDEYSLFVNKTVIEKLRLKSQNQKANEYTKAEDKTLLQQGKPIQIWRDWYVEMAQAKAVKKIAKILPIGDARAQTLIAADDRLDSGSIIDYKQTAESGIVTEINQVKEITNDNSNTKTSEILDKLANKKQTTDNPEPKAELVEPEAITGEVVDAEWPNDVQEQEPEDECANLKRQVEECKNKGQLAKFYNALSEEYKLVMKPFVKARQDFFNTTANALKEAVKDNVTEVENKNSPAVEPEQQTETSAQPAQDWESAIRSCKNANQLTLLMNGSDFAIEVEYSSIVDEMYDSFRSQN